MTAIRVEVVHAHEGGVWRREVELPCAATLEQALAASGFREAFPGVPAAAPVGVFGRLCAPQHVLQAGDRVEIYRPLVFDPMESRRRRALHRARKTGSAG